MYSEEEKKLKEWLDKGENTPLLSSGPKLPMYYIIVPFTGKFLYLYGANLYARNGINQMHLPLHFLGVYHPRQEKIYAAQRWFVELYPNTSDTRLLTDVVEEITPKVRSYIEDIIGNDRSRLEIAEFSENGKKLLEIYKREILPFELKKAVIDGVKSEDVKYRCMGELQYWEDKTILDYLDNPNAVVEKMGKEYIEENQENILLQFRQNDILKEELRILEQSPKEEMQRLCGVGQALTELKGKRVKITVEKDGEQVQFSWQADRFFDGFNFSAIKLSEGTWRQAMRIAKNGLFYPEDVVDISYHGKSWYSAEPYNPEPKQEPLQSM